MLATGQFRTFPLPVSHMYNKAKFDSLMHGSATLFLTLVQEQVLRL